MTYEIRTTIGGIVEVQLKTEPDKASSDYWIQTFVLSPDVVSQRDVIPQAKNRDLVWDLRRGMQDQLE